MEMTLEQRRALALAAARQRAAQAAQQAPSTPTPTPPVEAAPEPQKPFARAGWLAGALGQGRGGAVGSGIQDALIKTGLGVKQLFGGLSDTDKVVLRELEAEKKADPYDTTRTVSEVGTNIATLAVPGAQAERSARILAAAGRMGTGRAAQVAAAGAGSGATEFLTSVGEGDSFGEQLKDKAKNALSAAALGSGAQGVLSTVARPFRPTKEAEDLFAMGVNPTLQQGADSRVGRFIGGMAGGAGAQTVARRQNQEVIENVLGRITPGVDYTGMSTSEIAGTMDRVLSTQRDQLFKGKIFQMTPTARQDVWRAAASAAGREKDEVAKVLQELGGMNQAMRSNNNVRMGPAAVQMQRDRLQDAIELYSHPNATTRDRQIAKGLIAAKNKFDEVVLYPQFPGQQLDALKDWNSRYADSRRVMDAASTPEGQKQLKISQIMRSYSKMDPKGGVGFAKAENPMQSEVLSPAVRTMDLPGQEDTRASLVGLRRTIAPWAAGASVAGGSAVLPGVLGVPLAAGYGTSLLGQTKQGARTLLGQTKQQKQLADFLRNWLVVGPTAPGLVNQEYNDASQ